jgi:hypothetical protein
MGLDYTMPEWSHHGTLGLKKGDHAYFVGNAGRVSEVVIDAPLLVCGETHYYIFFSSGQKGNTMGGFLTPNLKKAQEMAFQLLSEERDSLLDNIAEAQKDVDEHNRQIAAGVDSILVSKFAKI